MAMIFYKTNHSVILIEVVNIFDLGFSWFRRGLQINYFPTKGVEYQKMSSKGKDHNKFILEICIDITSALFAR